MELFDADFAEIKYTVIGKVNNVALNGKVVSWDFVQNAQSYTLELYKGSERIGIYDGISTNSMTLNCEDAGNYTCKVIANSNNKNTATGTVYSDNLNFEILDAPEVSIGNYELEWNAVTGAQSYLVTINHIVNSEKQELTKTFVDTTSLVLEEFESGNYEVEVVAYSNNKNVLPSKAGNASWSKLGLSNLRVVNGVLFWDNTIENTSQNYEVVANGITKTINGSNSCSLDVFEFTAMGTESEDYYIKVKALGTGTEFDSDEESFKVTKLPDAIITKLQNKVFSVYCVNGATCQVKIYKDNVEVATLGSSLTLDVGGWSAGKYVAKAIVKGNGADILDATNESSTSSKEFTKLAKPTLSIVDQSLYINDVEGATNYTLTENGDIITGYGRPYDLDARLTGKTAGKYVYKVKAIGNNLEILDSDESVVNVKKLTAPTVEFDKTTLVCTANTISSEKSYVGNYTIYINEMDQFTTTDSSNSVACKTVIQDAGEYRIQAVANPKATSDADYDLILASDKSVVQTVNKLSGKCSIKVEGRNLIITPSSVLKTGASYTLTLVIKGNDQEVTVTATNMGDCFKIEMIDEDYIPYTKFEGLFDKGGSYDVYTDITPFGTTGELASNSEMCDQQLEILGTVTEIYKQGQSIRFKKVAEANNYKAIITLNNVATELDIKDKIQDTNAGYYEINIADLKALMESKGISYLEAVDYKIKFIATATGDNILPNYNVKTEFVFQFLKAPSVEITTNGNGQKILNINAEGTVRHNIIIKQGGAIVANISDSTETSINLDDISDIAGGEVEISINNIYTGEDVVFDSSYTYIRATKLALSESTNFTTEDGKLIWDEVANAKYYSLQYYVKADSKYETINLSYGSTNFIIKDGKCVYDFKDLEEGDKTITLQIFGEEGNFLNSEVLSLTVHKLIAPTVSVLDGKVCINITEDIAKISNVNGIELGFGNLVLKDLFVRGNDELKLIEDDQSTTDDDEKIKAYKKYLDNITIRKGDSDWTILIDVNHFIEYGTTELLEQIVWVKLHSTTAVGKTVLNSNVSEKTVKGLLAPINIKIEKSLTTNQDGSVTETAEKIVWDNLSVNTSKVTGYQVIINYDKKGYENVNYTFDVSANENFLEMPKYYPKDKDANGDNQNNYNEDVNNNNNLDMGEDIDGNGELNGLEQAFLEGNYRITIRALTSDDNIYVHSKSSEVFEMTILSSPQNIGTNSGNITWTGHERTENYVIRIYKLSYKQNAQGELELDENGKSILNTELEYTLTAPGNQRSIDISRNVQLDNAVYGVTVQALSTSNENVLTSKASSMLQIVRLPQESTYIIDDGKLYVKVHKFYTECQVILKDGDTEVCALSSTNTLLETDPYHFNEFVKPDGFTWLTSSVLDTFDDSDYYTMVEFELANEFVTNVNGYSVEIKLIGNTREDAVVTTYTTATNANKDENGNAVGLVNRMPTPSISIDETARGVVNLKLDRTKKDMKYFATKDGDGKILDSLRGVHLYKTTIFADKKYVVYMADIVDPDLFYGVYPQLIGEDFDYFEYGGIKYNVVNNAENDNKTYVQINLNVASYNMYHYYQDENGQLLKDNGVLIEGESINLSLGGSIIIQSQMLGDDSVFVNSNTDNGCTIMRYKAITPSLDDGQIKWLKQDIVIDDSTIYESAYLIEVSNGVKIMLYNPDTMNMEDLVNMLKDEGKNLTNYMFDTLYQEVIETDANGEEVTYIVYNNLANKLSEKLLNGGEYNISVWAHYTNVTENNIILAQTAPIQSVTIIPKANIDLVGGMLTWNMPYVSSTSGSGIKIFENYQLYVFIGNDLKTTINLTASDYEVNKDASGKNIASLDLKRKYGTFEFTPGTENSYTFKIVAVGDDVSYINSASTTIENKNILGDIGSNLAINNGVVTWTGTGNDEVKVIFRIPTAEGGSVEYSFKATSSNGRYELPAWVEINKTYHELSDEYSYVFSVRAKGNNSVISGFFSNKTVQMQRLSTVTTIAVTDGKVIWNESVYYSDIANGSTSSDGVTYTVYYTITGDTEIKMIEDVNINEVDVDDINGQSITVLYVIAHHKNYADSSEGKQQFTFTRLNVVDIESVEFVENGTVMQWEPSKTGESINRYYKIKVTDGSNTRIYDYELSEGASVANWTIEIDSVFKAKQVNFEIKTLSKGDGYLLNSLYSTPVEKNISASIASLSYDSNKYAIYWTPINSGKIDTYYVGYKFNNTTNVYEDITSKIVEESGKYYYYLEKIGTYSGINTTEPYNGIYIRVVSSDSAYEHHLASRATRYNDTISFDIFNSGSGIEGDAYVINNETQLENIKYRKNASFELGNNISLSSGYENIDEFSGMLDGKGKYIYGSSSKSFAGIFNETSSNAVLKNINISGFNVDIVPTSANFNFAILVNKASNTTFENIVVVNSTITFTKSVTTSDEYTGNTADSGYIYIGVIAGYAINCTFTDCMVIMKEGANNIIIKAKGNSEIRIYVGSIVGGIEDGSITTSINTSDDYTFSMESELKKSTGAYSSPYLQVGAVAGFNNGATISGTYYKYLKDNEEMANLYSTN